MKKKKCEHKFSRWEKLIGNRWWRRDCKKCGKMDLK